MTADALGIAQAIDRQTFWLVAAAFLHLCGLFGLASIAFRSKPNP